MAPKLCPLDCVEVTKSPGQFTKTIIRYTFFSLLLIPVIAIGIAIWLGVDIGQTAI